MDTLEHKYTLSICTVVKGAGFILLGAPVVAMTLQYTHLSLTVQCTRVNKTSFSIVAVSQLYKIPCGKMSFKFQ